MDVEENANAYCEREVPEAPARAFLLSAIQFLCRNPKDRGANSPRTKSEQVQLFLAGIYREGSPPNGS